MEIIQSPSPNKDSRRGYNPEIIVTHITDGYWPSDKEWLRNPQAQVSSHYIIGNPHGEIHQLVPDDMRAWHAGRVKNPLAPLKRTRYGAKVNPNQYTLGIEVSVKPPNKMTSAQITSWVWLVKQLSKKWNIPQDRAHNWGHSEIYSAKTCPAPIVMNDLVSLLSQPPGKVDRESLADQITELVNKLR